MGFFRRASNEHLKLMSESRPGEHYVYIFQCEGGKRYCGMTCNVINRFVAHMTGEGAKFTRGFPPIGLLHLERVPSYMDAVKRERNLKDAMRKRRNIGYRVDIEYQGVFEMITEMLKQYDGPYIKKKLNAIEKGG